MIVAGDARGTRIAKFFSDLLVLSAGRCKILRAPCLSHELRLELGTTCLRDLLRSHFSNDQQHQLRAITRLLFEVWEILLYPN